MRRSLCEGMGWEEAQASGHCEQSAGKGGWKEGAWLKALSPRPRLRWLGWLGGWLGCWLWVLFAVGRRLKSGLRPPI